MPKIMLSNPHSDKALVVWVEPWGRDYWMNPGDELTFDFDEADYAENMIGKDNGHFLVSWLDDGIVVWPASRYGSTVRDQSGTELDCGHQRPAHVDLAWREAGNFGKRDQRQ
ncbi:hypothetical protein ACFVAV_27470 [Nocardia sp. NPDC057663]|uniref:hypothetical protein n=1 Tax=Nocardia sp. NPDC057663 TaxID=3346201 RepID=UPI0036714251